MSSRSALKKPKKGCFVEYYNGESVEVFYARLKKKVKGDKVKIYYNDKWRPDLPKDLTSLGPVSEAETAVIEKTIREMIHDAVKRRGNPQSYLVPPEILKCIKTKPLPWNILLRDFLEEREDEESSYLTPERKYIHMDLIIPGIAKVEDELGEIWAFVDTSGSIEKAELNHFISQLCHIASQFRCTFNVAFWDTSVTEVYRKVRNKNQLMDLTPHHSGGTDINCVYEYIRKERIKPKVMLILTDGYFGLLKEPAGRLEARTILVVSEDGREFEKKNGIGKLARL
jgi:predicted metal-dependent peptidase